MLDNIQNLLDRTFNVGHYTDRLGLATQVLAVLGASLSGYDVDGNAVVFSKR